MPERQEGADRSVMHPLVLKDCLFFLSFFLPGEINSRMRDIWRDLAERE